jgi:hypothetical protein
MGSRTVLSARAAEDRLLFPVSCSEVDRKRAAHTSRPLVNLVVIVESQTLRFTVLDQSEEDFILF